MGSASLNYEKMRGSTSLAAWNKAVLDACHKKGYVGHDGSQISSRVDLEKNTITYTWPDPVVAPKKKGKKK